MALDKFTWCVQVQNGGGAMTTTNSNREVAFGNGFVQLGSAGFNTEKREYVITYVGKDFAAMRKFMRDHMIKPFAFTPPNDTIGIFTTKPDSIKANPISRNMLEISCSIVERFTAM